MIRTTIAISGTSSEVGKTTLLCDLLREFPAWEAIKMTRGHYRSCGKDPHTCCVSGLLAAEPVILSGRDQTYACGKDTGRYWDAGASNVHWVIVTDDQVERGIKLALDRVTARGVLIEGNSFLDFIDVDFAVLAAGWGDGKIKSSARRAFQKTSGIYLFAQSDKNASQSADLLSKRLAQGARSSYLPVYTSGDLSELVTRIKQIHSANDADLSGSEGAELVTTGGWYV